MVRQAHSYLAGAVSGTALIASAIVAFVVLVSLQAVRDWPLANVGGAAETTGISTARPAAREGAPGNRSAAAGRPGTGGAGKRHGGKGAHRADVRSGNAALGAAPASSGGPLAGSPGSTGGGTAGGNSVPSGALDSGAGGGSQRRTGDPATSTSGSVAGTLNHGVSDVDQTTGGALGEAGVTQATEETVNGVAGPESTVGETVDKATETIGGLTGG